MKLQPIIGTNDILPSDWKLFQKIRNTAKSIAEFYGFKKIATPILERPEIFEKTLGPTSELLEKQLYTFRTKGGERVVLRPQGTVPIMRAFLNNALDTKVKHINLWYTGPFFRYEESVGIGRYRQFYQIGFESIGSNDWSVDVKIIAILYNILKELGIKNLVVAVNSLGDSQCLPYYKKQLSAYLRHHRNSLCADCRRRMKINPLSVLRCPEEKCQRVIRQGAPKLVDSLCKDCHTHFKNVLEALEEFEIPFSLDPFLVRDFAYYSRTVFEIYFDAEGDDKIVLAGGGRYENLSKLLSGKIIPGCGGALGVERVALFLASKNQRKNKSKRAVPKIFLAQVGTLAKIKSLKLLENFRKANIRVGEALHRDSLSAQLKIAEKKAVRFVLIMGQKEALENKIILRDIQTGKEKVVSLEKVISEVKKIKS